MNRRLMVYLALVLIVGLYLYDRETSTETVLPATVTGVEARDDAAGPEIWHITAQIGDQRVVLSPLQARPDLSPGDRICVTRIQRPDQPDELRRANAGATC
ncbi:hypothetical protein [Sulfitobacter aestuariivivens]|uniref:Uncharacterized protein n=1 Tax=Sulfitobacter aestuariivivens TaxID=2766981 RepID=A0A927D1L0_9RHOB|nr:hypothetical protein [Sulfitobacter aestuariivivens]MBD3663420.1 hypothetical protein [Sulfitobacter aestuariivivens]